MPKVFEKDGYLFFFYMNEHLPIHIHVMKNGKKAKFEVSESEVLLVADGGLVIEEWKLSQSGIRSLERSLDENDFKERR
jgi:hypothetical protein